LFGSIGLNTEQEFSRGRMWWFQPVRLKRVDKFSLGIQTVQKNGKNDMAENVQPVRLLPIATVVCSSDRHRDVRRPSLLWYVVATDA
jgi:hypothetical protein